MNSAGFLLQSIVSFAGGSNPFFKTALTEILRGRSVTRQADRGHREPSLAEDFTEGAHLPGGGSKAMHEQYSWFPRKIRFQVKLLVLQV